MRGLGHEAAHVSHRLLGSHSMVVVALEGHRRVGNSHSHHPTAEQSQARELRPGRPDRFGARHPNGHHRSPCGCSDARDASRSRPGRQRIIGIPVKAPLGQEHDRGTRPQCLDRRRGRMAMMVGAVDRDRADRMSKRSCPAVLDIGLLDENSRVAAVSVKHDQTSDDIEEAPMIRDQHHRTKLPIELSTSIDVESYERPTQRTGESRQPRQATFGRHHKHPGGAVASTQGRGGQRGCRDEA